MIKGRFGAKSCLLSLLAAVPVAGAGATTPHNVILFVPDGLRAAIIDPQTAPTLARLRDEGVNFVNSHSLFPTFTTANASAFATGHGLGDTGDFSNTIYTGVAFGGSVTPFLENDQTLRELNMHLGGNYLHETPIVTAARNQGGASTAVIGKLGPVAIFDGAALRGQEGLVIDDATGIPGKGVPLSQEWLKIIEAAKLQAKAVGRGENGNTGDAQHPGTWVANLAQQQYFLEQTIKVVLPKFKEANEPFVLVYWSRDPDGSQHNQGDGSINGPTSLSAIRAVDSALAAIEQSLKSLGLYDSTDIIVSADHGFSTIDKSSRTSPAAAGSYADTREKELPPGFLAMDLTAALRKSDSTLQLYDPDDDNKQVDLKTGHPGLGNGVIASDPKQPQVIIAANGGSDLIYIPAAVGDKRAHELGTQLVQALLEQDYVSGLFVNEKRIGKQAGALSMTDIGLIGAALTPVPAIVVNFRSFVSDCQRTPVLCAREIADTRLQGGQGMHGSFSRADTWNFMAARGPDFRPAYVDSMPASNADIGMTIAHLLGIQPGTGKLSGRVLQESLREGGKSADVCTQTLKSQPAANGLATILKTQRVGSNVYFDVAGFSGRTVGLED
jgi:predicted AlkP superfamily pyrophosphatase or phosphodiesterase